MTIQCQMGFRHSPCPADKWIVKFKVKLRLIDASGKKHKYSLNLEEGSKFTLGRGTPGIGAELNHPTVSTAHCHLTIKDGVLHVMDNKSRNGTKLNGKSLQSSGVRVGDMLQLGVCQIEFFEAFRIRRSKRIRRRRLLSISASFSPEEAKLFGKIQATRHEGARAHDGDEQAGAERSPFSKRSATHGRRSNRPDSSSEPFDFGSQSEEPSRATEPSQDVSAPVDAPVPDAYSANPFAAPNNAYAAPTNPHGAPSLPGRPGEESPARRTRASA